MNKPITDKEMREWTKREWEKTWKGLTDEERQRVYNEALAVEGVDYIPYGFARAVEAELKEKNTAKAWDEKPQITHAEGCWSWGPAHYACACAEIAKLRGWQSGQDQDK